MWFFCFVVAVALSNDFHVYACHPLIIGPNFITVNSSAYCTAVWHTNPPLPSIHPGYKVSYSGQGSIKVSLYWKDSSPLRDDDVFCEAGSNCCPYNGTARNFWFELPNTVYVTPLEMVIIRPPANLFYFTRLVVTSSHSVNSSDLMSNVHIEYADHMPSSGEYKKGNSDVESTNLNLSLSENVKTVLKFAGSKIPPNMTGSGIDVLIELFWPENKTNIWDEVLNHIRYLIDRETFAYVNNLLNGQLLGFKSRLAEVAVEIRTRQPEVSRHYMNVAEDLIGFGDQIFVRNHHNAKRLNFDLIPLYANVVSMKALYYSLGLKCSGSNMYFEPHDTTNIERYLKNMIRTPKTGADDRLLELFKGQQELLTDRQYDRIMFARNALKRNGYSALWNNLIDRPVQKYVDDGIIFSPLIGQETSVMLDYAHAQVSPLTPIRFPDGTYDTVKKVEFFSTYCSRGKLCIRATKVMHNNDFTYELGSISSSQSSASDFPFSSTVQFQRDQFRITSIRFQESASHPSSYYEYTLSAGMNITYQNKQVTTNYIIGVVSMDKPMGNVTLEISTGYKVAGMLWDFKSEDFRSLAVSFVPDRGPVDVYAGAGWLDWQC